jgi:hypothetical protein
MQHIFERSVWARWLVVAVSSGIVISLVHAAVAHDNGGVMQFFNTPSAPADAHERQARSGAVWPLRTLNVKGIARTSPRRRLARTRILPRPNPVALALPQFRDKPVLVSILEDRTLRAGDAVMTYSGIRIFMGTRNWPYTPQDFKALASVKVMDPHLRKTLAEIDGLPRSRLSPDDHFAIRTQTTM